MIRRASLAGNTENARAVPPRLVFPSPLTSGSAPANLCSRARLSAQGRQDLDFAPSVYEHAARLIGRRPWEVSRDADLMFEGHAEAYRLYEHRPVVVGIDI